MRGKDQKCPWRYTLERSAKKCKWPLCSRQKKNHWNFKLEDPIEKQLLEGAISGKADPLGFANELGDDRCVFLCLFLCVFPGVCVISPPLLPLLPSPLSLSSSLTLNKHKHGNPPPPPPPPSVNPLHRFCCFLGFAHELGDDRESAAEAELDLGLRSHLREHNGDPVHDMTLVPWGLTNGIDWKAPDPEEAGEEEEGKKKE